MKHTFYNDGFSTPEISYICTLLPFSRKYSWEPNEGFQCHENIKDCWKTRVQNRTLHLLGIPTHYYAVPDMENVDYKIEIFPYIQ